MLYFRRHSIVRIYYYIGKYNKRERQSDPEPVNGNKYGTIEIERKQKQSFIYGLHI